jgi:hypothetical protein
VNIDQFKITVEFDIARESVGTHADHDSLAITLNGLFNDVVKNWTREKRCMASTTKTTVECISAPVGRS